MQQRRPRLGDIVDDYCPRERRITNHAVVAMIEDEIRQTRCTTCDSEHEFKQAKMPTLRRKKESAATAYKEVLDSVTADATMQAARAAATPADGDRDAGPAPVPVVEAAAPRSEPEPVEEPEAVEAHETPEEPEAGENGSNGVADNEGRVHRRLIRATLPRPANQPAERPVPEFTMRQPQGRGGKFRPGGGRGPGARLGMGGRGGQGNTRMAGAGFGRGAAGRTHGPRNDFHRPPRAGQPARHGKKHSK